MRQPRAIRTPPPLPYQKAEAGVCRACGVEILQKDGVSRHRGRRWCDAHKLDGKIMGQPHRARAAVFQRDLGVCCDCGCDCTSYMQRDVPAYRVQINRERALEWCKKALALSNFKAIWPIDLGDWHVDHAMPLHLVDREDPEAWQQWTLENLRTRCHDCHEAKSTKEAKVRAKIRRITGVNKPKHKRKIAARPFPKSQRKLQSRPMRGK